METDQRLIRAALCQSHNGNGEQQILEKEKEESVHIEIGLASEANESTPLLSKQRRQVRPTFQPSSSTSSSSSSSSAVSSSIYTKECLNWRILLFFSMIMTSLTLAIYLLWRQSHLSDMGYSLELIDHDIWSNIILKSPFLAAVNVSTVFITHTASEECYENCVELLHRLQDLQLEELPYNFLITSQCQTFEARGWNHESNFAEQIPQSISLVIAFVGDFTSKSPNHCQLKTVEALIRESLKRRRLQMDYQVFALRNITRDTHDAEIMKEQLELWSSYGGERMIK